MAVDTAQLIRDAECILACVPPGMVPAAILGQFIQPSIIQNTSVTMTGANNAVLLLPANPKRRRAILQNTSGANVVGIGNSSVTSATGYQLSTTANAVNSRLEVFDQGEVYGAATAGTVVVVTEFLVP